MREGNLFNGVYFSPYYSLKDFSSFGVNIFFKKYMSKRCEVCFNLPFSNYRTSNWIIFLQFFYSLLPFKKNILNKYTLNIFFLDVINVYRGWRHSRGLPTRGQRTWTNAWSAYKSNLTLRHFKINLLKRLYAQIPISELNIAYAAEQFNLLWKLQWQQEWREARKSRLKQNKNKYKSEKIDLFSMSTGQINPAKKLKGKSKKNKGAKMASTLGFDPGFTKLILNQVKKK